MLLLLLTLVPALAFAQWPDRPIRVVLGGSAGGPPDAFARIYAEQLSQTLGVPIVVENRTGATGNIAQDAVAKAASDGNTLLYAIANSFTTHPYLFAKLPFNSDRDFAPIAPVVSQGLFLVVNNDFPAKNLAELIALVRAKPDTVAYASYGQGGFPHLFMEMLIDSEKLRMTHVPYRTSAIPDVIGNQVPMVIEPAASAIPMIKAGKVRAIAFTPEKRHPALPDVPTFSETHQGLALTAWHGFWAPTGTPANVIARLNRELTAASHRPDVQKRIRDLYCEPMEGTPEAMAAMVRRDQATWSAVIKSRNIKLD
ncbi:MAG: tripartite tricarboxylate transporter substrate binding protein [Proteobacteria bacterium]|nr:tripartite tricarboxylate transporter substrate binding protein [Pseudomonadota bacterium]